MFCHRCTYQTITHDIPEVCNIKFTAFATRYLTCCKSHAHKFSEEKNLNDDDIYMAYHAGHFKVIPLEHDTAISVTAQLLEAFADAICSYLLNFLPSLTPSLS
jgi:hypothetical protein